MAANLASTGENKEIRFGRAQYGPDQVKWSTNKGEFLDYAARVGSRMGDFEDPNNYLTIMRTALDKARNETFDAGPDKVKVTDDEIHQIEGRVADTIGSQYSSKMHPQQYVEQCRQAGLSDKEIYDKGMSLVLSRRTYSPNYRPTPDDISFFAKAFGKQEGQVRKDVITGIMKDYGLDKPENKGRALTTKEFYKHIARALRSYNYSGEEAHRVFDQLRVQVESTFRAEPSLAYADPLHGLGRELRDQYPQLIGRDSGNMDNLDLPLRLIERSSLEARRKSTSWTRRRVDALRKGLVNAGVIENPDTKPLRINYPSRQLPSDATA